MNKFLFFLLIVISGAINARAGWFYYEDNLVFEYFDSWSFSPLTLVGCTDTEAVNIEVPDHVGNHPVKYVGSATTGEYTFKNCKYLETINLPSSIIAISGGAFNGCKSLKEFTIPKETEKIATNCFMNCDNLSVFMVEEGNEHFTAIDGVLFNKDLNTLVKYPSGRTALSYTILDGVEIIKESAFYTNTYIEEIRIPNSTTEIGYGAFSDCSALKEIEIPNSVHKIGASAFKNCKSLINLTIPSSVTSTEGSLCSGCSTLKTLTINADIESYYDALQGISELESFSITSPNIKNVNLNFNNDIKLKFLNLSESITNLILNLENCPNLETLNLPASLTIFEYRSPGDGLKEFNINQNNQFFSSIDGVLYSKDLKELLFYPPKNSIAFTVPNHVERIGKQAFLLNKDIKEVRRSPSESPTDSIIILSNNISEIGTEAFSGCRNLKSVDLPNNITQIGLRAFFGATSLEKVSLPVYLESLGDYCFYATKTNVLKLPPLINEIKSYECDTLYVSSRHPVASQYDPSSFEKVVLCVPMGYKDTYLSTEGWNYAKEIKEVEYTWVENISIDENQYFVDLNTPLQLSGTIAPHNATFKYLLWSGSTDSTDFTIDKFSGEFIGYKKGIYKITASPLDGGDVKAETTICVGYEKPSEVSFPQESIKLTIGWSMHLEYIVLPENSYVSKTEFFSSNPDVVDVTNGFIYAKSLGTATITVSLPEYGLHAECMVTVIPDYVETLTLDPTEWEGEAGETFRIVASISPANASNQILEWTSSDPSVASVSENGIVTAMKPGNVVITATATDGSGVEASCNVTVKAKAILVETITLDPTEWDGEAGETFRIVASISPANATNQILEWSSSDESVATVDSEGLVTVIKEGNCVITAKTTDGSDLSAECAITSTAGVDDIFADDSVFDVFNLQGVLIKSGCGKEDLKTISSGVYILRSGNQVSKIIIR